ncbi:hypothetical protein AYO47_06790 [Planctomyces sp. SCGC AG-212-M04]|nr:hypothetical protein AYO47_06790 [Planctomyces sp. SCGC AG-212-M04]
MHMPVKAMCPECQTQYNVPDTAVGKKVKCRTCEFVFPVKGQKAAARPAPKDPWETDDSEDDVPVLKPAKKTKPSDGLPPKIVKKKKATYIADDDDEEDDPKPKKKKKKRSSEMDPRLTFLAIAIGVVVLGGLAGFFQPQVPLWIGIIAMAGGGLWQLMMAFEEDDFTGWLHMRVPGYSLYFAITRISETWPAVLVQFLGLMLVFSGLVLQRRQHIAEVGQILAKEFNIKDVEDPADIPMIKAARPFVDAISQKRYEAAFAELSPLAVANAYRDQFIPRTEREQQRTSVAPLTQESFKELMGEAEKVLGTPISLESLDVVSRDPEILSGRGDAIERSYVMGGTPESVPTSVRRAALQAMIATKHPDFPDAKDGDGPSLKLKIILTEEDGKLRVGYFELSLPSILD